LYTLYWHRKNRHLNKIVLPPVVFKQAVPCTNEYVSAFCFKYG
jgi:hypothetical protein